DLEIVESPLTSEEFLVEVEDFLKANIAKTNCLITLDHIGLSAGKDNKKTTDEIMHHCVMLKKKYTNPTFIILTHLNREIEGRTHPMDLAPRQGDLYQSSTMAQAADGIVVVHNPYKIIGHKPYLNLSVADNPHL